MMVKNTKGGSGHKKFAHKNTSGPKNNKLRISEDAGEMYAIVTKINGNSMFNCHCIDSVGRLGHIRGKFSGRGKRDNMVECGKWILIGLRQWNITSEKSSCLLKDNESHALVFFKFLSRTSSLISDAHTSSQSIIIKYSYVLYFSFIVSMQKFLPFAML